MESKSEIIVDNAPITEGQARCFQKTGYWCFAQEIQLDKVIIKDLTQYFKAFKEQLEAVTNMLTVPVEFFQDHRFVKFGETITGSGVYQRTDNASFNTKMRAKVAKDLRKSVSELSLGNVLNHCRLKGRHNDVEKLFTETLTAPVTSYLYNANPVYKHPTNTAEKLDLFTGPNPLQNVKLAENVVSGIQEPILMIGERGSISAAHQEEGGFHSTLFHVWGATKSWVLIPTAYTKKFKNFVKKNTAGAVESCAAFLQSKRFLPHPKALRKAGITFKIVDQHPGEIIFVPGLNYAWTTNLMCPDYPISGNLVPPCKCLSWKWKTDDLVLDGIHGVVYRKTLDPVAFWNEYLDTVVMLKVDPFSDNVPSNKCFRNPKRTTQRRISRGLACVNRRCPITDKNKQNSICPACGKIFQRRGNMMDHMRATHTRTRLQCKVCTKTFALPGSLRTHMRNAH